MAAPPKAPAAAASVPQLPEKVMMALVSTPAMFALPPAINTGFNPPFVLRDGVVSPAPTQIKATVAAYVLQKDQAGLPHLPYQAFCCFHTSLLYHTHRLLPCLSVASSLAFGDPTNLLH